MKSLYDNEALVEIKKRIQCLNPNSKALWGKMKVAQMLAHCTGGLLMAKGDIVLPRRFIGRLIAPIIKSSYYNDRAFPKGINTDKALVVQDKRAFEQEKKTFIETLSQFHSAGPSQCTKHPHPFLGSFTPDQWAMGMYKHIDHHLRQFGV